MSCSKELLAFARDIPHPAHRVDRHPVDSNNELVTAFPNIPAHLTEAEPASPPPDWGNVPFDVGCARCGQDLRGQTEPKCPACGLEFDWSEAVPIEELICEHCGYHLYGLRETRCPECGERFTWDEVLAAHYRRKKPLFEYRWRHQPIRSFLVSWRLAMYPRKLWRMIDIHDPPQVRPLMLTVAVAIVALFVLAPAMDGLSLWSTQRAFRWVRSPGYSELPLFILRGLFNPTAYLYPFLILTWVAMSLGALMIFRQSMRLCRVRTIHVLRVWVYSVVSILPLIPLFGYVCAAMYLFLTVRVGFWTVSDMTPVAWGVLLVFVIWSLMQGYRHYLRMPHGLTIAVASQIIAILAVPALLDGLPRVLGMK